MKRNLFYLPALLLGLLVLGCSNDDQNEPLPPESDASALNSFFEQYRPARQTFQVNPQAASSITGAQGTEATFSANTFMSGNSAVSGPVTIELIEVYSRGDLLLMQKPTISRGRLLVSAGQVYLKAFQQGNPLVVGVGEMRMPQVDSLPSSGQMQVFFQGSPDQYGFNWIRATGPDTTAVTFVPADSLGAFGPHYRVAITDDTLGWMNISHLFNQPGAARAINGQLHGLDNYDGFVVYCVYKNLRSISPFRTYVTGRISSRISLPDDQEVTLVAIGKQDGRYYYGFTEFESGSQQIAPQIHVSEVSEMELINAIRDL